MNVSARGERITCTPADLCRVKSSKASEPEITKTIVSDNDSEANKLFL